MASSTEPQHRAIFWIDIAGSSDQKRTDVDRHAARAGMYRALRRAFRRARLPWSTWNNRFGVHREDRGDGAFCLIPPSVPKRRLVAALPALESALEAHNRDAPQGASIRLRAALHAGEVHFDNEGVSGNALDYTARLLDAPEFKELFDASDSLLGVITSDWFFQNVVRQHPAHRAHEYTKLPVSVRQAGPPEAYVRLFPRAGTVEEGRSRRLPVPNPLPFASRAAGAVRPPRPVRTAVVAALLAVPLLAVPGGVPAAACTTPPVQLKVRVSAEKQAVIQQLALAFEDATRGPDGCRSADLNVVSASHPGGAREALHQGWLIHGPREVLNEADVWLPDSSLEVRQVEEVLRKPPQELRLESLEDVRLVNKGSVATSQLVLAVPAAMADGLGLSGSTVTWEEVLSWPDRGYSFGQASPRASSAGLLATAALYKAELGVQVLDEASLERTEGVSGRLHAVEQAITREDDEPGKLLCAMRSSREDDDLRRTALLVSEKAFLDYQQNRPLSADCGPAPTPSPASSASGRPGSSPEATPSPQATEPPPPELRLFYVEDRVPLFDHPYVMITRAHRPSAERRRIIDAFHRWLQHPERQHQLRKAGYRDASPSREAGLAAEVPPEALLRVWNQARKSARVLFAVDVSRSMAAPFPHVGGRQLSAAAEAIGKALPLMGSEDQIGLWEFAAGVGGDDDHRSLVEMGALDQEQETHLATRLGSLKPGERGPAVLPAIEAAVRELRKDDADPDETTRAVIVLTDGAGDGRGSGQDTAGSGGSAAEAAAFEKELSSDAPVRVFVIAFHPGSCAQPLGQITQTSGGACYEIDGAIAMQRALDGIATGLWGTQS